MIFELEEVLLIQKILISEYGGALGVRDQSLLESSLSRPLQTFDGKELYPTPVEKAAAVLESIVINHPFLDGNKRMGYVLMRMVLLEGSTDIEASQQEKYEFVIEVASGKMKYPEILTWIQNHKMMK
jgi:death-on-curing protein